MAAFGMMHLAAPDPALFDPRRLEGEIRRGAPPVAAYREALALGREHLKQGFDMGAGIDGLCAQRAWLIDQILLSAWRESGLDPGRFALLAVGGYGRGELHPGSDVDVAIVTGTETLDAEHQRIAGYVRFLWDIGLDIGHSVRTVEDCGTEAGSDITVMTNLMEARLLSGSPALYRGVREATAPDRMWPPAAFFEAKLAEQTARHARFHGTAHNLEPNIKEGPGGLRDIHTIAWVAKRQFGAESLRGLLDHGFLSEDEQRVLSAVQSFLWRVRFALHLLAGRREDRLLFDYQRHVAARFGYGDQEGVQLGVERFMKHYYRMAMELRQLNEMLLQLFREAILESQREARIEPLNKRFQVRNGYLDACHDQVFERYPCALLEVFLLLQQHREIEGVRASTIRLIRDHRHLIDDKFRKNLKSRALFMEIIRQPRGIGHELARMHRYGVLGAYLPVFGAVAGLMQFDLFHVYTVDVHTLFVVQNLRRFSDPESAEATEMCRRIMAQLPKPELLYIAGLYHDIAKGRGADHSELGGRYAAEFCNDHGLSHFDARLVAWLVEHHLLMSMTAQRRDITDPEVINEFARAVGDRVRLDYLYLLTIADIRGTNPSLWNSWKDALLTELYDGTLRALRRGVRNPLEREEWIAETKGEALATLMRSDLRKEAILSVWRMLGEEYFVRHWPDEIPWHTEAIARAREEDLPLCLIREMTRRGGTEIFIYGKDHDHVFATTTWVLEHLGITIMDARIIRSPDGYSLDTYIVLEAATHQAIRSEGYSREIVTVLRERLRGAAPVGRKVNRRLDRQLRHFRIPTEVSFSDDPGNARTAMEVIATDRPGVLSQIARAMRFCGVRLQSAKVATFGERVEDIFYITDAHDRPLEDPLKLECLRYSITTALAQP